MNDPNPKYYDPPAERHENGTVVPIDCICEECHAIHIRDEAVGFLAKKYNYLCCIDQLYDWEVENEEKK